HAQYMETRGASGAWDPGEQRYTLYADVQYPHRVRTALATNILRVPEHQIRVIAGDVGGGFGTKGWQYPEHRLVLWAARRLRRPRAGELGPDQHELHRAVPGRRAAGGDLRHRTAHRRRCARAGNGHD